eukprot:TRINITY_DN362_c0_g5_i1.p1 TRINITY_DN362_c0_g5~~TRINITY_DN362_c0_g5_i1.p1  ORF type:complete len:216 (+),score=81.61 TRINITY_DN362_c0_g5_i1:76-723(+)
MSKINPDYLRKAINELVTQGKKRKFVETVELQIGLRDYDPEKEKRFSGAIRLPFAPYPNLKVCVIGTAVHCEQAQKAGIESIDSDGLKKFNKEKKLIKKWAKPFDLILASDSIIKNIQKLLGNTLNQIGKFPLVIRENDTVLEKVDEMRGTVRFQLKKVLCMGTAIATLKHNEDEIRKNITIAVNFLVSLLKKGWQNINTLHIKTTMGKPFRIYG